MIKTLIPEPTRRPAAIDFAGTAVRRKGPIKNRNLLSETTERSTVP